MKGYFKIAARNGTKAAMFSIPVELEGENLENLEWEIDGTLPLRGILSMEFQPDYSKIPFFEDDETKVQKLTQQLKEQEAMIKDLKSQLQSASLLLKTIVTTRESRPNVAQTTNTWTNGHWSRGCL